MKLNKSGDVSLMTMPQANGQLKSRPILLLKKMPPYGDWLVCGISTQLQQEAKGFDQVIHDKDPYFKATGLKSSSLVRLGFLATIPDSKIPGSIGTLPQPVIKDLLKRLATQLIH